MKLIVVLSLLFTLNSCGNVLGVSEDENSCGYRYISGHDCIVCSKGGVSCKW